MSITIRVRKFLWSKNFSGQQIVGPNKLGIENYMFCGLFFPRGIMVRDNTDISLPMAACGQEHWPFHPHPPFQHCNLIKKNLGGIIFWFGLFPSVAQLSSAFPYFSCFPNAADMLPLSSSSTSMTSSTISLLTNHRPRKCDMTERKTYTHFDIITTNALRAAAVKTLTIGIVLLLPSSDMPRFQFFWLAEIISVNPAT